MEESEFKIEYDFAAHPQILAVCVFGSVAIGNDDHRSDIDIALIFEDDFDLLKNYDLPLVLMANLEGLSRHRVDVIIFNKMDPVFQKEIRVKGKLLFVRDREKLKRIFSNSRNEYDDYLARHEYYSRAFRKRYLRHG